MFLYREKIDPFSSNYLLYNIVYNAYIAIFIHTCTLALSGNVSMGYEAWSSFSFSNLLNQCCALIKCFYESELLGTWI